MVMPIGRQSQVYTKKEAVYGVEETLASTDALRHLDAALAFDPFNRVTSPEKKQSPGPANRFDRKQSAGLGSLVSMLRPGGALNTLPELDPILEAAFGSVVNRTESTTVLASPAPTTTTSTVAAAGALAVGDGVLITVTGESGPFVRVLTVVAGDALTWSPALPAAPSTGAAVKGGITYQLTTDLAISLTIAHYLDQGRDREVIGCGIDQLTMSFDANEEPRATASGPASDFLSKANVQTQPAAFTTVGATAPPSGIVGNLFIDAAAYKFTTSEVAIANGLEVRNQEYGVNKPTAIYRKGRREITISLESFIDDAALYDLAEAGTNTVYLKQTGLTEGNIVAVYAPVVEWKVPDQDDPDEEPKWSFTGLALESADAKNDELTLCLM